MICFAKQEQDIWIADFLKNAAWAVCSTYRSHSSTTAQASPGAALNGTKLEATGQTKQITAILNENIKHVLNGWYAVGEKVLI